MLMYINKFFEKWMSKALFAVFKKRKKNGCPKVLIITIVVCKN